MPEQPPKLSLTSHILSEDKLRILKELLPEVFTEGNFIDWDRLRLTLGSNLESEEVKERFGLTWPGKRNCFKAIQSPTAATLLPDREASVDFDTTENLYIEGDNLEVLKLLQKSYLGKVKMIYIDPPYNTGNDFVYPDDYTESLKTYLEYTGQVDAGGRKFTNNSDTTGRFHSKWLNMMYPRLFLARNLLREDGVIFISIDDTEVAHLRKVCDEIFGEENFVGSLIWKSRISEDTRALHGLSADHEFLLLYRKTNGFSLRGEDKDKTKFSNPDDDPRGPWRSADATGLLSKEERPNCHYDLIDPSTGLVYRCPPRGWRFDKNTMDQKIKEGRILFPSTENGRPRHKLFINEMKSEFKNFSSILSDVNTALGTKEMQEFFNLSLFSYPKSSKLLKKLIIQSTSPDDIVLDFFSGSATTAHAVLALNAEDGGNRKFILVQLPEPTRKQKADGTWEETEASRAGFSTISEIGMERIRRVIAKLKAETTEEGSNGGKQSGKGKGKAYQVKKDEAPSLGFEETSDHLTHNGGGTERSLKSQDLGFRVFRLAPSNFPVWNGNLEKSKEAVEEALFATPVFPTTNPIHGTEEAILFEVLLKSGIERALATNEIKEETIVGQKVFIAYDSAYYVLGKSHTAEVFDEIMKRKPSLVIARESGFSGNDVLKANVHAQFRQMKDSNKEVRFLVV
ncbi:MAG: site-specific DNA-methyltransferase [Leptospira sp.]|nr:site-specific DNA-methyltransferase [Leptospira sp.]